MKIFSPKIQLALLRALIRNYRRAASCPKIAKALILQKTFFTEEKIREVVSALVLNDGDWELTKKFLGQSARDWSKLFAWGDKMKVGSS